MKTFFIGHMLVNPDAIDCIEPKSGPNGGKVTASTIFMRSGKVIEDNGRTPSDLQAIIAKL